MSLRLISKITITQQPTTTYPERGAEYVLDFVNDIEITSSWKNMTDTAKIVMPKKVYVKTPTGIVTWQDKYMYANTPEAPIIMRGDRIKVELGYYYKPTPQSEYRAETNIEFEGYITKINPKVPLVIECEDNMWLLKQAQCPNKVFPVSEGWTVQKIVQYLLLNSSASTSDTYLNRVLLPELKRFNVINGVGASENIQTNVGDFRTQNETIAQVLQRLRKDYKIECFFRPNAQGENIDLYVSGVVYYPSEYVDAQGNIFATAYDFENNIITDDMVYLRKDDLRLGIKAYSIDKKELTTTNSSGGTKTQSKRLETFVGDTDGEIRTQFFWDVKTEDELKALATQRLNKLKYEGWRGQFTSFGLPFVRHGQAVSLKSKVTPERGGAYLVKGTKVKFGMGGFRRMIDPHIRIDDNIYTANDFANGI